MSDPVIQSSFAGGEVSPLLYGRVDLAKFHTAVSLARNFFVDYRGGLTSRAGTEYGGTCVDPNNANWLIPFQFSTVQTYALVFGNLTLRVAMDGAWVTEPAKTVVSATNARPCVLQITGHGFSTGNELALGDGFLGMTSLNGLEVIVTVVDANHVSLADLFGAAINTSTDGAYTSGGTAARVFTLVTPYVGPDVSAIKFTQSADTMTLTHPGYAPMSLTRTDHWVWTLSAISFVPGNLAPTSPTATPSSAGSTVYQYVFTAVGKNGLTESLPSAPASASSVTLSATAGSKITVGWVGHAGDTLYNVYRTPETDGATPPLGSLYGYVGSVNPAGTNTFVDNNILPDFTRCPPQANNPFDAGNNPISCTYYQQRLVFGGEVNSPDALAMSRTGDFYNFSYSVPARDDDDIEVTLASQKVNAIKHMVPMTSLIVLTDAGAWRVDGGSQSDAVTPSHIFAVPQAYNGCAEVPPLVINYDVLYVTSKQTGVRDLSYNFYVNIYTGEDISALANHLFFGHNIVSWCWAEEPHRLVWAVRGDGILLSLTYIKEQQVYGWCRHDTNGLVRSVCSISEGNAHAVYLIVERFIGGHKVQYLERMASRLVGGDPSIDIPGDVERSWCVDAGLALTQPTPGATLTPADVTATGTLTNAEIISGGSGYTAPVVEITDPAGAGAVITVGATAGVITHIFLNSAGTGYTAPTVTVVDPTGLGAVLSVDVQRLLGLVAGESVFTGADIGKVLRISGGRGTVVAAEGTGVTIDLEVDLNSPWPAVFGEWTLTAPVSSVTGLQHLEGCTVAILADGGVQPQQQVVNGAVTLEAPASSVVVGLPFQAQIRTLYLDVQQPGGTMQSKRKKQSAVTLRTVDARGLKVGPTFSRLVPVKDRTTEAMGQPIRLFTGDRRTIVPSQWDLYAQVCVQLDDPVPATVTAIIPEIDVGDS